MPAEKPAPAEKTANKLAQALTRVRGKSPLVHCITNYVTANDCANVLLACGASPIMADDPGEAEEITSLAAGLVLNLGTLDQRKFSAMLLSGKRANALGISVVLDPVGAGASSLRTESALRLLQEVRFSVIRGNMSEIRTLALGAGHTYGVDAGAADRVTEQSLPEAVAFVKSFSAKTGAIAAVTGGIDLVADGGCALVIRGGHPMMGRITGAGCMLSALTGAFAAANRDDFLTAAAAAVCAMDLCGEKAAARVTPPDGSGSFRTYLLDAVYNLTPEELERGANYELR